MREENATTMIEGLIKHYKTNGVAWGADLLVLGDEGIFMRVGAIAAILRLMRAGDQPVIRTMIVVVPTNTSVEAAIEPIRDGFLRMWKRLASDARDDTVALQAFTTIRFVTQPAMSTTALIADIRAAEPQTAFIIADAGWYRGSATPTREAFTLPEDTWAPHIHELASLAVAAGAHSQSYVALEVGAYAPERQKNTDLLMSVDECPVLTATVSGPSPLAMAVKASRMSDLAAQGHLDAALAMLAEQGLPANAHALIRLRLINDAGAGEQAAAELTANATLADGLRGESALQGAILADNLGAREVAAKTLTQAIPGLATREALETALSLASKIGDPSPINAAEKALLRSFPASVLIRRRKILELVQRREFSAIAPLFDGSPAPSDLKQASFWRWLAQTVHRGEGPDRDDAADAVAGWPDEDALDALRACGACFEDVGRHVDAMTFLLDATRRFGTIDEPLLWAALDTAERALLANQTAADAAISETALATVQWLAARPNKGHLRLRLMRLLRPEYLGRGVLTAVAQSILPLAGQKVATQLPSGDGRPPPCAPEALAALLTRASAWLDGRTTVVPGRTMLPRALLDGLSPEQAVSGCIRCIEAFSETINDDQDARGLENVFVVAAVTAPLGSRPGDGLVALRIAAGRLALFGRHQRARDLAEHALSIAGDNPNLARLAWFAFADLYSRTGNATEALVGLACASAAGGAESWEQICYERQLGVQIFRDIGFFGLSRSMLGAARDAFRNAGMIDRYDHRLDFVDLNLQFLSLDHDGDVTALLPLVEAMTRNLETVLARDEDAGPATVFLASLVGLAGNLDGSTFPVSLSAIDRARNRLGAGALARIDAIGPDKIDAERFLALARLFEEPRHAEDTAYDVRHLVVAARRLLDSGDGADTITASLAIEALADQALVRPFGANGRRPLYVDKMASADVARKIALGGLDVVLLGLSAKGLTHVTWTGNGVGKTTAEPHSVFSPRRFEEWRERYPHAYCDAATSDVFHRTTLELGVSALPDRAVVIAGTRLQAMPPNLLQVGGVLAGNARRLAVAPSLAWLDAAQHSPFKDGRAVAWIPVGAAGGPFPLETVATALTPTFDRHGVLLKEDARPPADLAGVGLAIIVAHGGLGQADRFFHSLEDDTGATLRSGTLAKALSNAGTAVLFVCSGGRLDEHPGANMTVGLVREILAQGCRAVIASPWPIFADVTVHWLPAFLQQWQSGAAVIDACFEANSAVRMKSGFDPRRYLAMTVYGDPLARLSQP